LGCTQKICDTWKSLAGVRSLPVRLYLGLLTLVIAVPLIGLAFYVSHRVSISEREATRAALMTTATSLTAALDRELDKYIAVASTLARSRQLLNGNWPEFYEQAKESIELLPKSWLTVVDKTGLVRMNTLRPLTESLLQRPLWDAEMAALRTGQATVSDVLIGKVAQRLGAFVAVPVVRDGDPLYILDLTINPEHLRRLLEQQRYPNDWRIGIVDRTGKFIARFPDDNGPNAGQTASAGWRRAIQELSAGSSEHIWLEGDQIVAAYAQSGHGWTVGVLINSDVLEAPLRRTHKFLLVASLGCLGVGLAFAWLVARRFDRSAAQLSKAATALAQEVPVTTASTGIREYDQAITAFAKASNALTARSKERERVERALRASEQELERIIKHTPFMLAHCSRDFRYRFISNAYAEMIGCKAEDVIGKSLVEVVGPQGFATIEPYITKALQGERVDYESDVHFRTIGPRTLHVVYVPEVADGGEVTGWIASLLDITEAKRASAAEKILVRELQHRSNNLLAVIQAVAQRSLSGPISLETAKHAFIARLHALAWAHKQLTNSNWTGLNLSELVQAELKPFAGRTKIDGLSITLAPQEAQNFSLALHELTTNAAKYGALSSARGEVWISWAISGDDGTKKTLHFEWREVGGPAVHPPTREGFGTSLLRTVFGDSTLIYASEGFQWAIDLPIEN
jgi:PAS domain S-box-containing protein